MSKAHRLKVRKPNSPVTKPVPINFLLGCSEVSLANFQLARQAEAADMRTEMHAILDRLLEQSALAMLATWFRSTDRNALKHAIENPEDVMEWAQEQIRLQRRTEEGEEGDVLPIAALPLGAAHLAAAMRYQERNIAEGKCQNCPKPLDRNSVRYCTKHLAVARARKGPKGQAGSVDYLYGDGFTDRQARHPNALAALAMGREQRTRAFLAEQGIAPESGAVAQKAAMEALLKCIPHLRADAMTQTELFERAVIPSRTTGREALKP
jgi:hypothetical protein